MPALFRPSLLTLSLTLALLPAPTPAEEADDEEALVALYGDTEMVSIATGTAKPVYRAPSVASVITAEDIAAMGARNLDEVLEAVPGLHVSRSVPLHMDSVYGIRGIATGFNPQTLILINGIRFGNLHNSGRMPNFRLPVSAIKRIEIMRGPGSAVYGADAYAGVINIITFPSEELQDIRLAARRGSFDTTDGLLQFGTELEGWHLGGSIETQRSDGDKERRIASDLQTILDAALGTRASLAPDSLQTNYYVVDTHLEAANGNWTVRYWNWQQNGAGYGAGVAEALDPVGRQDVDHHLADLGFDSGESSSGWSVGFHYAYQRTKNQSRFQILPPGALLPIGADGNLNFVSPQGLVLFPEGLLGNPGSTDTTHFAEVEARYMQWNDHRVRLSAGGRHEATEARETKNFGPGVIDGRTSPVGGRLTDVTGTPYVYIPDKTRSVRFISAQDEWALAPDWELTAGVRFDDYSDFGSTTNPRLALVWSTAYNLTTKLLYGKAFRAPSFSELYFVNNPIVLGNPDLEPETIDTLELAFDYRPTTNTLFALTLFDYRARDLIEFTPDANAATKTARNARNQDGRGFELEAQWTPTDDWLLKANVAHTDASDAKTGWRIHDVPREETSVDARWHPNDNWQFSTEIHWIAERKRAHGDTRRAIDDYAWADLTTRYAGLARGWELSLSVRNVADADATAPSDSIIPEDYPLEGRSVWLGIDYRFSR